LLQQQVKARDDGKASDYGKAIGTIVKQGIMVDYSKDRRLS